ncbi:SMI1/KNR4 family protein [Azospirillum sp. B4]|uniref:SMI1/KNR4 family protein n=1 Tax=Azospirillum sp. B4 TaxID=95605 RepID=UPI0009FD5C95|nr:SMI1/KNR4 family protein [Azospirillum sp. B4]
MMIQPNTYSGSSYPLSERDVAAAESKMGIALPEQLKSFTLHQNGGRPKRRYWHGDGGLVFWVDTLIPIEATVNNQAPNGMVTTYLNTTSQDILPKTVIPFARDPGGNFFCIDADAESIWYYAMDVWDDALSPTENHKKCRDFLADSFEVFMNGLSEKGEDDD